MTEKKSDLKYRYALMLFSSLLIVFSFLHLEKMLSFASYGLNLCVRSIIPSLLPFMIFSDMLLYSGIFEKIPRQIQKLFERTFKIRQNGLGAFLTGALCGFPLGIKYACDLYRNSKIDKNECQRLICFCNNTGPAFVIAGIGISIRGSALEGVLLYTIQIISAVLYGIISSRGQKISEKDTSPISQDSEYSIIESIKKSSLNMLYICALVMFFSIICGYVAILIPHPLVNAVIASFLEVSNASLACNMLPDKNLSFVLTAGAISFSGMSVHLQGEIFYQDIPISKGRYYCAKLLQSGLSMALASLILLLTYRFFPVKIFM